MKLTQFLVPENIRHGVVVSSKKRALELVGKMVAEFLNQQTACEEGICGVECFGNLFKREKLGSTSLNHGVALPHAKLPLNDHIQIEQPVAVFLQLETPIDYESADHKEVDLIYAIMFPEESCAVYKDCLPKLAQKLGDKALLKRLRNAENAEEIWQLLEYTDRQTEQETAS